MSVATLFFFRVVSLDPLRSLRYAGALGQAVHVDTTISYPVTMYVCMCIIYIYVCAYAHVYVYIYI